MKRNQLFSIVIVALALLALSVGLTAQHSLRALASQGMAQEAKDAPGVPAASPLGGGFLYQGELNKDGSPVDATCQGRFSLYDAASGGNLVGGPATHNITVTDGRFTTRLDFGSSPFTGEARWLEVAVQCPGDGDFSTLSPRQPLTAAPYALGLRPGAVMEAEGAGEKLFTVSNTSTETFSDGIYGATDSTAGSGVVAYASSPSGETYGVWAESVSSEGRGVYGYASAASGNGQGVRGASESSTNGVGVYGYGASTSGTNYGVFGRSASPDGAGVHGTAPTYGVYGRASLTSGSSYGVYGEAVSTAGVGVYGISSAFGVVGWATDPQGRGLQGYASATSGGATGVEGVSLSPTGYAGYFVGNVQILGNLSKSGGSFKIDHPLAPADKYLYHSFVESPDMKNIYDGVVILDERGEAWVKLPAWFEALNGGEEYCADFRYQLTPIGVAMPNLYVAEKIQDNQFKMAGGVPGMEVSWQVTSIRHDPWAEVHRIPVEQEKPEGERGTYLYPELYGQPEELGLTYKRNQGLRNLAGPAVPGQGGAR